MHYHPPEPWSFAPFVLLLLSIAVLPLLKRTEHWWERNRNKLIVSLSLALLTVLYYGFLHPVQDHHHEEHLLTGFAAVLQMLKHAVLDDYIPFIVLLFCLYTISGGIVLRGDIEARPRTNCAFLGIGALLASFMGTTGASMLLIRPLLRTNSERRHKVHTVVFFIFMVSNIGGCLTPLGDPPLFLGYLRGVPFWWTLNLLVPWLFMNAALLLVYFVWDSVAYSRESKKDIALDETRIEPLSLRGKVNFFWLLCVVACVATVDPSKELPLIGIHPAPFVRELLLLFVTALSWLTTPGNKKIRRDNEFNFHAITEVAFLFIGIFICMQAPVEYLRVEGPRLGIKTPEAFFWVTGSLSSFLDNAPTYVVFFKTATSLPGGDILLNGGLKILEPLLLAISLGAVFMGANTYIGNGPNFMVKTIAEQGGVKMPSFFGYMVYSILILFPLFFVSMWLFL
jgi:Na+/H+ antiporter NhaD/arsenite permease-like protein